MSTEPVVQLLERFREAARDYGIAMQGGDAKSANLSQRRIGEAYKKLRGYREGRATLLEWLASEDLAVRYMAAVYTLDSAPAEGERVLEEIAKGPPSPLRMLAQVSLRQWRAGLLQF